MSEKEEKEEEVEFIPSEELTTPVETLVAKKAEELYKKETGKEWKKEPPEEKQAEEYVRKAGKQILAKWLEKAKTYYKTVETVFGAPPERRMLLVQIGKKTKLLPMEEIVKPAKVPAHAIIQCPKCGMLSLKQLVPGIWQCTNCYYTLNTLAWFPRKR